MRPRLLVSLLGAVLMIVLSSRGGDSADSTDPLEAILDASEMTIGAGPALIDGSIIEMG